VLPAAARALLAGVVALTALRLAAALLPGRALWGLDLWRDLAPTDALVAGAVTLAACVPAVGARLARWLPDSRGAVAALALAGAASLAVFAWVHPDRARFTGDATLRTGEFARIERPETVAPQAARGDLLLHHALPRALGALTPWSPDDVARAQGAAMAALAALAGWRLALATGAGGAGALAVAAVAACTGALALDNGYAKATVEVCALTTVLAVGLVRLAAEGAPGGGTRPEGGSGSGLGTVGVALALALLLHRSALALVPAWLAGIVVAARAGRFGPWRAAAAAPPGSAAAAGPWSRFGTLLGALAPPAALVVAGPFHWQVASSYDRAQHLGGGLFAALSPARIADAANVLLLLVPLAVLAPLVLALAPRPRPRALALAAALVLPPVALLMLVPPRQGLVRDWDVFAFAGSALAAVLAWRLGAVFAAEPRARAAAPALALAAILPALQWAALQADAERAWARAESILTSRPLREREERAQGLATLGMMRYGRGERDEGRRLFQLSLEVSPHPRMLVQWGILAGHSGRAAEAMGYYRRALEIKPDLASAWQGVAETGIALGDAASVRAAVARLDSLEPANPALPQAREWLGLGR
jgi:tetratricopeptide (TPR) repeat protein